MENLNIFKRVRVKKRNNQIMDIVTIIVLILVIALSLLFGKYIFSSIDNAFTEGNLHTTESAQAMDDMSVSFSLFDWGILFAMIGLTIGLLITSYFIPSHPVFVVINIVGLVFLVFIGAVLSNLYGDIVNVEGLSEARESYGGMEKTDFIMTKLPFICAFLVLISSIVMYAKGGIG